VRRILLSLLVTVLSLGGLAGALLFANFGAELFWYGLLLAVPLSIGLPSTAAVLACIALWPGGALPWFAAIAVAAAAASQIAVTLLVVRVRARRAPSC